VTGPTGHGAINIVNQMHIAVYVMPLIYRERLVMETPDASWEGRVRMAHEAASYMAVAGERSILSLGIRELTDLDPALEDRNVISFDPPDPNGVVPEAQQSELLLVYGEQVVVIPFKISYQLNGGFYTGGCEEWFTSHQATADAQAAATRAAATAARNTAVGLGVAILAMLLVIVWLFWRLRRGGSVP
jgi:hypothetical protein